VNLPPLVCWLPCCSWQLLRDCAVYVQAWRVGLDEASQAYFLDKDEDIMVAILQQLHELIAEPPATPSERTFMQAHGAVLAAAELHLNRYLELRDGAQRVRRPSARRSSVGIRRSSSRGSNGNSGVGSENAQGGAGVVSSSLGRSGSWADSTHSKKLPAFQMDLEARSMWELYLKVFRPINKAMAKTKGMKVSLPYVSPRLHEARGLMVPIMGQGLIHNAHSGAEWRSSQADNSGLKPRSVMRDASCGASSFVLAIDMLYLPITALAWSVRRMSPSTKWIPTSH